MKLRHLPIFLLLYVLLCSSTIISSDHHDIPYNPNMTPSEMHQILAGRKAENLQQSRDAIAAISAVEADQTNYDVTLYEITIRVNDTTETVHGKVRFEAQSTQAGVTEVEIDLASNMFIDSITITGGQLSYTRSLDFVTVVLGGSYNTGDSFEFTIWYFGTPITTGLQAFSFDTRANGETTISSLSEPYSARTWWPCKDRMDDKPDIFISHIEVDTSLYAASNGTLDSLTTDGFNTRVFHYTVHYPMATYLFSVAIAPFIVWEQEYIYNSGTDTMDVIHHTYADKLSQSQTGWGITPQMLTVLSSAFGEYPFVNDKYGHANFEWNGGMEHQTVTSMTDSWFGFYEPTVVHEAAHQWWGDMITCKSWHDIWINEGWASYGEAVYKLETEGWASYRSYMNGMTYYGNGTVYVGDTTSVNRIFNGGLSYDKGAWVTHMLRGVLGETLWADGINGYYNSEYKYKAITTIEFRDLWETNTGVELDWFFDEWVFGEYFPNYHYSYFEEPAPGGGYDIYLMVKQVQSSFPYVFHMPIDFYFDYVSLPGDTLVMSTNERNHLFKLNSASQINNIELDPSDWILKSATQEAWTMHMISLDGELPDGERLTNYEDSIKFRGGSGSYSASILVGELPPGLSLSNSLILSGLPTDSGTFSFTVRLIDLGLGYVDERDFSLRIAPTVTCCVGVVGDLNNNGSPNPSVGDITAGIDFLFGSGTPLSCWYEADTDKSGGLQPSGANISVADLSIIIDHLFGHGNPMEPCP